MIKHNENIDKNIVNDPIHVGLCILFPQYDTNSATNPTNTSLM